MCEFKLKWNCYFGTLPVFEKGGLFFFGKLIVEVVNETGVKNEKAINITQALTFEEVVKAIAKSKADDYEIQDSDGSLLVGPVLAHFGDRSAPVCEVRVRLVPSQSLL